MVLRWAFALCPSGKFNRGKGGGTRLPTCIAGCLAVSGLLLSGYNMYMYRTAERWMLDWHVGGVYRALNVAVRMRFFMVENCGWVGIINVGGFFNLEPFFEML